MSYFYNVVRMSAVGAFMVAALSAYAESVQVGELFYDLNEADGTASLARSATYTGMTNVNIPGEITVDGNEYTVTSVAQQAFRECKSLESVTMGEGIATIGAWAFYKCSALTEVQFPSTLTYVMGSAFSNCTAIPALVLPDNLKKVDSYAFGTCKALAEVTLPKEMETLGGYAFYSCGKLSTIHFNAALDSIGENTFYGCGMTAVELPESLRAIGAGAFSNCTKLAEISLPQSLVKIGDQAFFRCSALTGIQLPDGIRTLGMAAFYECTSLADVALPEGITTIDSNCFYGCTSFRSMSVPASITTISNGMFYGCTGLENVNLHSGITAIGSSAFYGCSSLKTVELPAGITAISNSMFNRCSSLSSINIPESVTLIDENAFRQCTSLTELFIPKNVAAIGDVMVLGCTALQNIKVDESNPYYTDIDGVVVSKDKTHLVAYPAGRTDVYVMPESITDIDGYVFNSNPNISGIVFSKNLKTIGISAFYGCPGLTELDFPESLESIGGMAFFTDSNIKSVKLPNRDITIGNNALSLTGISNLVFPEGITTIGIEGESGFSIMGMCSSMQWMSLPSTLTKMSPLGSSCNNMTVFYSFAAEPPVLVGANVVTLASNVKVPKGSAEAYASAWSGLYPNLTYDDVLPGVPSVSINGNAATVAWEAYGDDIYTGAPVRYELILSAGGLEIHTDVLDGDNIGAGSMSHTFEGLSAGNAYSYEIKGYSALGQLTLLYTGDINLSSSGIDDAVAAEREAVSREYYDMSGRRISAPSASSICIVKTVYSDGSVTTEKHVMR